jgi:hypothetical protein
MWLNEFYSKSDDFCNLIPWIVLFEEPRFEMILRELCCLPMAEVVYLTLFTVLSGALNTQSARQTPKYCFLVGQVCCIHNIPEYRFSPVKYRQPKLPYSYQLHNLVLRHLSQVVKIPPYSGFEPGTSRTRVRRSNHYTIELCEGIVKMALTS